MPSPAPSKGKAETIVGQIARAIEAGLMKPRDKLPSIRAAAEHYDVAKNTVVEVYDRLVALGLVEARRGAGFFVAAVSRVSTEARSPHVAEALDILGLLREQLDQHFEVRIGDGRPPASWMEGSELGRHMRLTGARGGVPIEHGYGSALGYGPLRERLSLVLAERSIPVGPDQVLLTHGANHALDLIIRHALEPDDAAMVDDPGYYPLFAKLKLAKVEMLGVKRLAEGPDLDDFAEKAASGRAKIFFTQSLAHNPTGSSMSVAVAHRLLQIAARHGVTIVEDDPFADILAPTLYRLASLDQLESVIYLGTFAKTLSASLRVGYIAASAGTITALRDMKMLTVVNSSGYVERLVHDLMISGHYRHHLKRLKSRIEQATDVAVSQLGRFGLEIFSAPTGGYYLWCRIPAGRDDVSFSKAAAAEGIFIAPGTMFSPDRSAHAGHMRINVAYADDPRFLGFLSRSSKA
ncbi:MAG: PLP-dependent aminotransferase family protein [Phreatobacter sp.]